MAYADNLTLVGTSRADLQTTMDMTVSWFDMVGVRVNTAKTELLEWPRPGPQATLLEWRQGRTAQPITRGPRDCELVRILGQYIIPDGHRASMSEYLKGTSWVLAASLKKKWITDRQAQYMYRAVLCPVMAYKMQGVMLSEEEITAIQAPMLKMVKHKFGVLSTMPESFWFLRIGGRLPCLHAEYD
ncbi:hypothetical protein GGI09_002692 [Coemansia sp. S100]|nr:hypothetical protein GGI09_002692 [Coemansia sp. S100]KAJ2109184.1 hypothetical protein GGI16_000837 [Coemansia sp. S142-1]